MTFLRTFIVSVGALGLSLSAHAAGGAKHAHPPEGGWSFAGPLGELDKASMQRGYQVYREVCAACHSMNLLTYRNLGEPGGPFYDSDYPNPNDNPLVKQFAAEDMITDTVPNDFGEYEMRPARPSDVFRSPYPNEQAARAANAGAYPPDLSVITKARGHGADGEGASYVYSLMTGYKSFDDLIYGEINGEQVDYYEFDGDYKGKLIQPLGQYYNPYMAGDVSAQWIGDPRKVPSGGFLAMGPQLLPDRVQYLDGTEATPEQMAKDVATFLQWAGDPKQVQRKSLGLGSMIYLVLLAVLLWFSYKRIWRKVGH